MKHIDHLDERNFAVYGKIMIRKEELSNRLIYNSSFLTLTPSAFINFLNAIQSLSRNNLAGKLLVVKEWVMILKQSGILGGDSNTISLISVRR